MAKKATIPSGCWPALLRDEYAAAYVGEATVDSFMRQVGRLWPKPWREHGTGKGKYRVWRKSDLDRIIDPHAESTDLEAW